MSEFVILHREGAWKIESDQRVVGSYTSKRLALQRARQIIEAARSRGATAQLRVLRRRETLDTLEAKGLQQAASGLPS